jgi:hypothetical protein
MRRLPKAMRKKTIEAISTGAKAHARKRARISFSETIVATPADFTLVFYGLKIFWLLDCAILRNALKTSIV